MKVFVVYYPEDGNINDIILVTDKEEKAKELVEEDGYLNYECHELNDIARFCFEILITKEGEIKHCWKNYRHVEGVSINKFHNNMTVYVKADTEQEARDLARQKLEEKINRKTVEVIEWKE